MTTHISGLLSAPFTPMHSDGSIDTGRIPEMVRMLLSNGVKGIFVCGSTGEGPSLSVAERKELAEAFVSAASGNMKVFVHVGHNSLSEARELAAHAQEVGADYVSATPPAYFKINSISALVESLGMIASGAPETPLYYYHIPSLTGVGLDMVDFLEQAGKSLPTFAGLKYTTPYIHEFQACLNYSARKYDVLYGTDEMLLGALATGAEGFIGSTYNFAAPLYQGVIKAFRAGDIETARELQLNSVKLVRIIERFGGLRSQKAMMKLIGMDCGPVRLPLRPLDGQELSQMESELRKIGFFEWSSQVPTQAVD